MKGVLIFDDRSDLAFFSLDKGMEKYVLERIHSLDQAAGSEDVSFLYRYHVDPGSSGRRDSSERHEGLPHHVLSPVLHIIR